jgi:hypothetical protein
MTERRLRQLQKRVAHWQQRLDAVTGQRGKSKERSQCRWQLKKAKALAAAEAEMRQHTDDHPAERASWPWRAQIRLDLTGTVYHRGQAIPDHVVDQARNRAVLEDCGYIRRGPDRQAKSALAPAQPAPVQPPRLTAEEEARRYELLLAAQRDARIRECGLAMRKIAEARNVTMSEARDLVDSSLLLRAQSAWTEHRRETVDGAFGSGGMLVQSGQGTSRRVFNPQEFLAALCAAAPPTSSPQAA